MNPLLVTLLVLLFSTNAQSAPLRWGGDSEGGAPFVFQDPSAPDRLIGFEVDLANALADELDRDAEFVQNQWDGLIPGLTRGNYDIILNGLEITDERKREISFSTPYYVTFEQLTVRKVTHGVQNLDDLTGKRVGTLKSSLAERILLDHGGLTVITYDDDTHPYSELEIGNLDAVLMDYPIALYRSASFKSLKFTGDPIGEMAYGIGVSMADEALLKDINRALEKLVKNGKLAEILMRWKLWNDKMTELTGVKPFQMAEPEAYWHYVKSVAPQKSLSALFKQYLNLLPLLGQGALVTLQISILAMIVAIVLGLMIALLRLYAPAIISQMAVLYIEIVRGTPLLIQLYIIYYGLPMMGLKLSPLVAAVLGLGLNYAAYEAENYRAGIQSIPKSQMDAAKALGMSRAQSLRHVILPQAMRLVIPPVTNDFISLLKDSSLVSVITMVELTKVYGQLATAYVDYLGIGILAAVVYLLIGLPFVRLSSYLEKRFA